MAITIAKTPTRSGFKYKAHVKKKTHSNYCQFAPILKV